MKDSSVSYADCVQFIQGQFCNSNEHKHGINSFMQQPSHFLSLFSLPSLSSRLETDTLSF